VEWDKACKPPTGQFAMSVSYVSNNTAEDKAYAVALGGNHSYDESAWSVSFDDGDIWNQLSLIDTYVDYLSDVAVSPDGNKTMLVSIGEEGGYCSCDSVWLRADTHPEAGLRATRVRVYSGWLPRKLLVTPSTWWTSAPAPYTTMIWKPWLAGTAELLP
jgi:hypothetical protein